MGMVTMALIFGLIMPIGAVIETRNANVTFNDIKVVIDDIPTILTDLEGGEVEPILVFNTLYVPLSPIARALGKTSVYDSKTKTVYIGKNTSAGLTPVKLSDVNLLSTSGNTWTFSESAKDNKENTLKNCYECSIYGEGSRTYSLNGEYTKIEGTIYRPYDTRPYSINTKVEMYDGDKLLYESNIFVGETPSAKFSVNIAGVKTLKILISCQNTRLGISDVILYKK